ncbi:MAG: peroxiredoxin-like family protein [Proteobacteria bacterium]|nr:peroxiredoxin-like family protein [Pseudomonadota bacterium]
MQLHRDGHLITEAGARLVLVGNGGPSFIAGFREATGFTGPIYTDPSLAVFHAAQLKRGMRTVMNLGSLTGSIGAYRRGFRQDGKQGDALQQGGVVVIAPDNRVLWHHISDRPGDNADAQTIANALRAT